MTASRQASAEARAASPTAKDRAIVLATFKDWGELTADECARHCGWAGNEYKARRRCSDLKSSGLLEETGEFRKNANGNKQAVLRIPQPKAERQGGFWE